MSRLPLDQWFMKLAHDYAERGTCPRAKVGAVVAHSNEPESFGYNGAPSKLPHCTDVGCIIENDHCIRALHAEGNALRRAGRERARGAILYTTHFPCWNCCLLIVDYGIHTVVYDNVYRINGKVLEMLRFAGVDVRKLNAG